MRRFVALGGMMAALATSVVVLTTTTEALAAPAGVTMDVVAANGSGCPDGTASADLAADGNSFTTTVPALAAFDGDDAPVTHLRRNCQLSVALTAPEGWTYAVTEVSSSGAVALSENSTARSGTQIYFQGQSPTLRLARTFDAPTARRWGTRDTVDEAELDYAPCDARRYLNINLEVRASAASGGFAYIARNAQTAYQLSWRECS